MKISTMIRVCSKSGFRAGIDCPETIEIPASVNGLRSEVCPYHQVIHLNETGTMQVTSECTPAEDILNVPWFILPPAMEYFYRQKHPEYKPLPPVAPGCNTGMSIPVMEFIYPTSGIRIFIPRDQSGSVNKSHSGSCTQESIKETLLASRRHLHRHYKVYSSD